MSDSPDSQPPVRLPAPGRRELGGKLAGMGIRRQLFTLALWPLLEQVLGFAVATTDQVLAGRFSDTVLRLHALDALAVCGYFSWLLMILQGAVGTGGLALIARATGAGDEALARRALGQSVMLGTGLGLLVLVVAQFSIPLFLRVFSLEGMTAGLATSYLRVVACSAPLTGFILAANAGLRGSGDTRTPFLVMTMVNATNIGTSWLMTFGPAPFGGHGVAGLAGGTLFGWMVGAGFLAWKLAAGRNSLQLDAGAVRPHRATLERIVRVGLPSAVEVSGMWIINTWLLRMVAALPGKAALGAHILAIRAESLSFLPGFALGAASATLAGQYLGLGDPERAKQAVRTAWFAGVAMMGSLGLVFVVFAEEIIGIIVPGSELHIRLAAPLLLLSGCCQPLLATCIILKTTFRGTGDTRTVMRYSYGSMIIFRMAGAWLALRYAPNGLFWIWVCMNLDVSTQAMVFARRFFHGGWLRTRV